MISSWIHWWQRQRALRYTIYAVGIVMLAAITLAVGAAAISAESQAAQQNPGIAPIIFTNNYTGQ